jgi:hypothetical protein
LEVWIDRKTDPRAAIKQAGGVASAKRARARITRKKVGVYILISESNRFRSVGYYVALVSFVVGDVQYRIKKAQRRKMERLLKSVTKNESSKRVSVKNNWEKTKSRM